MYLIELRANKESFHTITFNKTGVSIIRAIKVTDDKKGTYNSTGKSLLIFLLHFCLGSSENNELREKLKGWEFYLDIEIDDILYTVTRNTGNQKIVNVNGVDYKLKDFTDFMQTKVFFNIPNDYKYISFRSLISRFIRPQKSSYDTYNSFLKDEKEYQELLNNSFLLGLDIERINKKRELRELWEDTEKKKTSIEKDSIMKDFFTEGIDKKKIDIEIVSLEQKIQRFSKNISEFKVSEDYDQIKKEADEISQELKYYKNKRTVLINAINNIEHSREIKSDLKSSDVKNFFEEANLVLNDAIKKRLEDVQDFNKKLLNNRQKRLLEDQKKFESQLSDIELIIKNLGQKEDNKLYLLKTSGSLDEFSKLNEQLSQVKIRYEKLTGYKVLLNEYKNKIDEIKEELVKENSLTNKYLQENDELKSRNIKVFSSFAEQFYANKPSGIIIENNEGDNLQRFRIEATIDSDSGDGVNNVKIFCFDWTLLRNQNNHIIKFIFHDSRLISEIDPRQIATMFQIAHFNSTEHKFQYIISANQKELDALKGELSDEEYSNYVTKNIIEDLTDESESGKLLGVTIPLKYEK